MAIERFMRKGVTQLFLVPTIASATLVPTATEVNAGVRIKNIAQINGFSFANQPIEVPDFDDAFTSQIGGEDKAENSSLEIYEHKTTKTVYNAFVKGTSYFMVVFPEGIAGATPAAADVADVWPVTVNSKTRQYSADNVAAKYMVAMSHPATPAFDKTLT